MPNYTPNSNLEKPLQTEFYNVDVPNANMDIIDGVLKEHTDDITALENGKRDKAVQIVAADIATNAVETVKIKDGAVSTPKIADLGVTNGKLANSSVDSVKLANGAVSTEKIVDLNVTTSKINDKAVVSGKIADGGVETVNIKDGAVTNAKIAVNAIESDKYKDGSIVNAKLADGTIENSKLKNNTIDTDKIKAGGVTGVNLNNDLYNDIYSARAFMYNNRADYGLRKIKQDVSTSRASSLTAWNNLSSTVKFSQGFVLSDKSLNIQSYLAFDGYIDSCLFTMYIKSNGVGDVTFYVGDVNDDLYIFDDNNIDTAIVKIATYGYVTIPAFTGVKKIYALVDNSGGSGMSINLGGLVNAELCDESEYIKVNILPASIIINVGGTYQLTGEISNGYTGVWSSHNTDIFTVDQNGLVTGVAVGTTYVKLAVGNVSFIGMVTVRSS